MHAEKKNYPAIDIVKFLCALVILFYHYCSEHGPVHPLLEEALSLYAVAVALFMTLSGYLLFSKLNTVSDRKKQWEIIKKQVKRILTIYLLWSIPYLIYTVMTWDWSSISLPFVAWKVQGWIFQSTFYTIWFMPALAVGTLFAFFLYTHLKWLHVCALAGIFYVIGALQLTYSFVGELIPGFTTFMAFSDMWLQGARGGIFFGMPLIIVGAVASRIKWRKPVLLAGASVLLMGCVLAEAVTLRVLVGGCGLDLAFSMVPLCLVIAMFLTSFSWNPSARMRNVYKWMRSMSILIFMTQRLFLTVIPYYMPDEVKMKIFSSKLLGGLVFCGATMLFSCLYLKASKRYTVLKKSF